MKKAIKFVLVLVMVGLMTFAPVMQQGPGTPPGPGPDERPIGYICTTYSSRSSVRPSGKTAK